MLFNFWVATEAGLQSGAVGSWQVQLWFKVLAKKQCQQPLQDFSCKKGYLTSFQYNYFVV